MNPYYDHAGIQLYHGDCLDVLPELEAGSFDSVVTDPPYGLSFMGQGWDRGVPGKEFWGEVLRVAKPGAHLLAFGGTRTHHRLMCAIEDAGWELRDTLMWVYGSGFPKSLDVSKAIDKAAGVERTRGERQWSGGQRRSGIMGENLGTQTLVKYDLPVLPSAKQWHGWGTSLKPAWEPILLARKPLAGTVVANVLEHRTGALNVDGCRVGTNVETWPSSRRNGSGNGRTCALGSGGAYTATTGDAPAGRWPANLIHDGSEEVVGLFPENVKGGSHNIPKGWRGFNNNGKPTEAKQLGSYKDAGSAARFFKCCLDDDPEDDEVRRLVYCAKASRADREDGLEEMEGRVQGVRGGEEDDLSEGKGPTRATRNHHPTVKPTALMRYLCRLVTPPGGIVLDPFAGSGSTGKGAVLEGFQFVGIELDAGYCEIASRRIAAAKRLEQEVLPLRLAEPPVEPCPLTLF